MSFTFQPEENETVRMSYTKGQTIYQIIITDTNFQSLYVDVQSINKCFCGGGKIDDNTTAAYFVKEDAGGTLVTVSLEIRFQKSKKMKTAIEEFEFILTKIDRDQQLEEIVKLKKENEILAKKVRIMETYQMGYFDSQKTKQKVSFPDISFITKKKYSLGNNAVDICLNLSDKANHYIWNHARFQPYHSMFKIEVLTGSTHQRYTRTASQLSTINQHDPPEIKEQFHIEKLFGNYNILVELFCPIQTSEVYVYENSSQTNIQSAVTRCLPFFCEGRYAYNSTVTRCSCSNYDEKILLRNFDKNFHKFIKYHNEIRMMMTLYDLVLEYHFRGKVLLPPTLYGDRYYMIDHPTDPNCVTHTFDLLKSLLHPPTFKDRLFLNPLIGFYQTPTEFL